jgi:hypothetical protein
MRLAVILSRDLLGKVPARAIQLALGEQLAGQKDGGEIRLLPE